MMAAKYNVHKKWGAVDHEFASPAEPQCPLPAIGFAARGRWQKINCKNNDAGTWRRQRSSKA
jgi:hypothetical protein